MKASVWILLTALVVLTGCASTRNVMDDDMYFTSQDANREARIYNNGKKQKTVATDTEDENVKSNFKLNDGDIVVENKYYTDADFTYDDYYDYSYSSRIKRFHGNNNSWSYYDPYYTNYYWYNTNQNYFGQSVYSTYTWWGPNFGNNYNSNYWGMNSWTYNSWGNGWYGPNYNSWCNPWMNGWSGNSWWNPYNPYAYNGWNNPWYNNNWNGYGYAYGYGSGYNNMYYNSFDNNCYHGYGPNGQITYNIPYNPPANANTPSNFATLMQTNGISRDVTERPAINYTALREQASRPVNAGTVNTNTDGSLIPSNTTTYPNNNTPVNATSSQYTGVNENNTYNANTNTNASSSTNSNTIVISNYDNNANYNNNSGNSGRNSNNSATYSNSSPNTNANTNTYRRYDNYNADINITPSNNNNTNMSRSGVFSEGSRNTYEYRGNVMPSNNNSNSNNNSGNTGRSSNSGSGSSGGRGTPR